MLVGLGLSHSKRAYPSNPRVARALRERGGEHEHPNG